MSPTTARLAAAALCLLAAPAALAEFVSTCPHICLGPATDNLLVTQCTVDGTPKGAQLRWSQFDLNKVIGYEFNQLVFLQDGNAFSSSACAACSIDGNTLSCSCVSGASSIDLSSYMVDVTGSLCFASASIGPICGTDSPFTC